MCRHPRKYTVDPQPTADLVSYHMSTDRVPARQLAPTVVEILTQVINPIDVRDQEWSCIHFSHTTSMPLTHTTNTARLNHLELMSIGDDSTSETWCCPSATTIQASLATTIHLKRILAAWALDGTQRSPLVFRLLVLGCGATRRLHHHYVSSK